jgi:hypothetical protein
VAGVSYQFAHRTRGLRSSAIRDLLKVTEMPHMLSLAGGLPTPDSFPLADLRREADRLLGEYGPRVVQYSATDGVPELRRWIAQHHSAEFGRPVAVDGEIVVTHGSQQALDLLAKVFIDPGDVVVSESPAYLGAVQSLELFEPRFEVIPGDKHGMQVELLAERLAAGLRPKLVYVVPNFHNPSGATLSLERRQLLAELADQYELLVVEDDPYGAIRFHGEPLPPVAAFSERVVHLSTFSKVVAPGFRVGWMVGPPEVIAMAARAKQAADLHTSTYGWPNRRPPSCRCTATAAMRWPTLWPPPWASASASTCPTAACSCGPPWPACPTPANCSPMRSRPVLPSCPVARSRSTSRPTRRCACRTARCHRHNSATQPSASPRAWPPTTQHTPDAGDPDSAQSLLVEGVVGSGEGSALLLERSALGW